MSYGRKQAGYSTLLMVMSLLLAGMLLLQQLQREFTLMLTFYHREKLYLQAYHQAMSALNWGAVQRWSPSESEWQCRSYPIAERERLSACVKRLTAERVLLRGEGRGNLFAPSFYLYRLMGNQQQEGQSTYQLFPLAQGWLDYCPVADEKICEE